MPDPAIDSAVSPLVGTLPTNQNPNAAAPLTPSPQPQAPTPGAAIAGTQPTQQPAQPSAQPKVSPQATAQVVKHAKLGQLVQNLLGTDTQYRVNAQTGEMEATQTRQPVGSLFRNILVGALLGGAAGSQGSDFGTGFGRGAGAGVDYRQQQDLLKRQQAQQQFEDEFKVRQQQNQEQRTANSLEQARLHFDALQQSWNVRELKSESDANLKSMSLLEQENRLSNAKLLADQRAGAMLAPGIPNNGQAGNGKDLQALFTKDPATFQAPAGYTTSITKSYDLSSGIKYDFRNGGWLDGDGNPTNLEDHTTWTVNFVPISAKDEMQQYSGAQLSTLFPHLYANLDPKGTYNLSLESFTGAVTKEAKLAHDEFSEGLQKTHQTITTALQQGRNKMGSLRAEYEAATRAGDDTKAAEIEGEMNDLNDQLQEQIDSANPAMRERYQNALNESLPAPTLTTPGNSAPAQRSAPAKANDPTVNRIVGIIGHLPPDQQRAQIDSSTTLTPAQKQAAKSALNLQ